MDFNKVSPRSMEFLNMVAAEPDKFHVLASNFISEMENKNLLVPDFDDSFDWLNTDGRLTFRGNLANKICVLDFFTYCCINCMHVLPDLHALEQKYSIEDGVAVVGVHSAKFHNEKLLENILSAVLRYDICHPVVNDGDAVMWNTMSIQCWPTFVIISPEGKVLLNLVGEGHRDVLLKFVSVALEYYKQKGLIHSHSLPIKLAKNSMPKKQFRFPGKLAISNTDNRIAVADSGNHQVVILNKDGLVNQRIGTGEPGYEDGSLSKSKFNAPQGLVWHGNMIFVADTENHVIRRINLDTDDVITLTGIGKQGNDKEGGLKGTLQEISSPWDVILAPAPGSDITKKDSDCMYIAMAGTHQIWCYFLQSGTWLKKSTQEKDICLRFAGSGNEENRNNSYPHKAAFAQPSGLTYGVSKDKHTLYVADSESSSIRQVDILSGAVKACVGAERDPMNLFAYGDVDGKGVDAKLQHPLGVEYNPINDLLYVADSYNHKIKVVDPTKLICTTLAGSGVAGLRNGAFSEATFNEPADLKFSSDFKLLYVADTNNHEIRILDMDKESVSTLITMDSTFMNTVKIGDSDKSESKKTASKSIVGKNAKVIVLDPIKRCLAKEVVVSVKVNLPPGLEFTEDVESLVQISVCVSGDEEVSTYPRGTVLNDGCVSNNVMLPVVSRDVEVTAELQLFVCTEDKTCLMKSYKIKQVVCNDEDGNTNDVVITQLVDNLK